MAVIDILPFINASILGVAIVLYFRVGIKGRRAKRRVSDFYGNDTDALINSKLAEVRFAFDADKAKIFQFHNGGTFIHGHSMKKMSLSYLQVKSGVEPPNVGRLQNLPTSFFPNMMTRFLQGKGVILWLTKDSPDAFLKTRYLEENVEQIMLVSIWNKQNNLVGFISLNWLVAKNFTFDEPLLIQFADQVGELMDDY